MTGLCAGAGLNNKQTCQYCITSSSSLSKYHFPKDARLIGLIRKLHCQIHIWQTDTQLNPQPNIIIIPAAYNVNILS